MILRESFNNKKRTNIPNKLPEVKIQVRPGNSLTDQERKKRGEILPEVKNQVRPWKISLSDRERKN